VPVYLAFRAQHNTTRAADSGVQLQHLQSHPQSAAPYPPPPRAPPHLRCCPDSCVQLQLLQSQWDLEGVAEQLDGGTNSHLQQQQQQCQCQCKMESSP
jgi:hypothetical protein